MEDILKRLGMSDFVEVFKVNAVTPDLVLKLSDENFKELGVGAIGHRIKLKEMCKKYTEEGKKESKPSTENKSETGNVTTGKKEEVIEKRNENVGAQALIKNTDGTEKVDDTKKRNAAVQGNNVTQDTKGACDSSTNQSGYPKINVKRGAVNIPGAKNADVHVEDGAVNIETLSISNTGSKGRTIDTEELSISSTNSKISGNVKAKKITISNANVNF